MIHNLVQVGHALLILIGAIFFVWSGYLLGEDESYLVLSPIHIVMMLFYFNVFLVNFNFVLYPRLSKIVNMVTIFTAGILFVYGDIVYYGRTKLLPPSSGQQQHAPSIYLIYGSIDAINILVLVGLNYFDYKCTFLKTSKDILVLLGFQYIYILNMLSQVIPLYSEKKIALTNDFAFLFWMIFILEEAWRAMRRQERNKVAEHNVDRMANDEEAQLITNNSNVNNYNTNSNAITNRNKGNIKFVFHFLFLICFYATATASLYFYVIINILDHSGTKLSTVWDYCLLSSNTMFYLWTFTTFKKTNM